MPFLRYVIATLNIEQREITYRFYITEGIRMISENTAMYVNGKMFTESFMDIIKPKEKEKKEKEENRTPQDVIDHIRRGLNEL